MFNSSVRRVVTTLMTVVSAAALIVSCDGLGAKCPTQTVKFPITGVIVKKETPARDCYMLHVKRDDNANVETVRVSHYRYTHIELRHSVGYNTQPTD